MQCSKEGGARHSITSPPQDRGRNFDALDFDLFTVQGDNSKTALGFKPMASSVCRFLFNIAARTWEPAKKNLLALLN
jgi:hypothetical protein